MRRTLLALSLLLVGCSSSPTGVSSPCREQKMWPVISAAGDTTWVSNRNQSLCQQTTFGSAGAP